VTRAPWLADVLRDVGLEVIETDGWRARGRNMRSIEAVVLHDTVTPPSWSDSRVAALLRDGYTGLPGPLSQLGLDRQGRFWLIADGRCNHNGHGRYGNNSIGVETFANGAGTPAEPWNTIQRDCAARAAAAICTHLDLPPSRVLGHKETDPSRKQDPFQVDMGQIRRRVTELSGTVAIDEREAQLMARFTQQQLDELEAMLDRAKRDGLKLDSLVHQFGIFHRDERPALKGFVDGMRAMGTTPRTLGAGLVALWREAGARGWRRDLDLFAENRTYTEDDLQ
jgi:hypothetical protein